MSADLTESSPQAPERSGRRGEAPLILLRAATLVVPAVAAATFWLAYDGGTFSVPSRSLAGVVVWWAIAAGVATRMLPRSRPSPLAWTVLGALCAYAVLATTSLAWGGTAEHAFDELNRLALYGGVVALVVLAAAPRSVARWCDGIALGLAAVAALALASRLLPHLVAASGYGNISLIPLGARRLSYPVGYWNGLGVLLALDVALLLRAGVAGRTHVGRALAAFPFPIVAAALYLTSSRTAVLTTAAAVVVFSLLYSRRSATLSFLLAVSPGAALAVHLVRAHPALVEGPFGSAAAVSAGRDVAALLLGLCVATSAVVLVGSVVGARLPRSRAFERALLVAVALAVVGAVVAAHPVRRVEAFTRPPATFGRANYVQRHLMSANGNGRWQLWQTAVEEWRTRPLLGRGIGTYEAWQTQHGRLGVYVRDAHSLYLQTLGELGIVGLATLVLAFGAGTVAAGRAVARRRGGDATAAALAAAWLAYVVSAGFDWMWQLPVVSILGLAILGLLLVLVAPAGAEPSTRARSPLRIASAVGVVALAVALAWSQVVEAASVRAVSASQAAASSGDLTAAAAKARDAAGFEPWASSPYVQLALVAEEDGRLGTAAGWIRVALDRDPGNWQLWLVSSRIAAESGRYRDARAALGRARALDPGLRNLGSR